MMIELDYWPTGQLKHWINLDDPVFGKSLWKRDKSGDSHLIKKIPAKFQKYFK